MLPLKVESLTIPSDSMAIGKQHKDILEEKLEEFTAFLQQRRHQLEEEFRTSAQSNGVANHSAPAVVAQARPGDSSDVGYDMRKHLQGELNILRGICQQRLDYLFHKFEIEWKLNPKEKPPNFPMPKSGTEAIYLGEQLGEALGRGLAEICVQRPQDPIEYLAHWLRKYSDNVKQQREDAVMSLKLRLVEEESLVIREQQELLARERKQIREDEERRRMLFLDQAKQIAESKQSLVKSKSRAAPGESRQEDDDDEEEEHLISATKRVTLVEPELTADLYTIDEKDSTSGGLAETNDDDAD